MFLRLVPALVLPCMLYALENGIPKWEVRCSLVPKLFKCSIKSFPFLKNLGNKKHLYYCHPISQNRISNQVALGGLSLWALLVFTLSTLGAAWAEQRGVALQALRTSTSTTLNGGGSGNRALVSLGRIPLRIANICSYASKHGSSEIFHSWWDTVRKIIRVGCIFFSSTHR